MKCIICGCTDDHACDEGCGWRADPRGRLIPVCTSCSAPLELVDLVYWVAEHACDGLNRLWKSKGKHAKVRALKLADATCVSMKSRRKCESCRARLLLGAV